MKYFLIFLVFFSVNANAAKQKTKKVVATPPSGLSDMELLSKAKSELDSPSEKAKTLPVDSGSVIVSTDAAREVEQMERFAPTEMEIGGQSYKPAGMKNTSSINSYTLSGVASRPMLLIGVRKWFFRDGLQSDALPWRAGFGVSSGFTSSTVTLKTNTGKSYDNVRINSALIGLGPDGEIFYGKFALGLGLRVGKVLFIQSTPAPYLNKSEDSNYWEATGSLRFQPTANFFGKLAYSKRSGLASAEGIQVQENSVAALLGFGI